MAKKKKTQSICLGGLASNAIIIIILAIAILSIIQY